MGWTKNFQEISKAKFFFALIISTLSCSIVHSGARAQVQSQAQSSSVKPKLTSTEEEGKRLNNEAVRALEHTRLPGDGKKAPPFREDLTDDDWQFIFRKFDETLVLIPKYELARTNLSIAYNNFGLYLFQKLHRPLDALRQFHLAVFMDGKNQTSVQNLEGLIRALKKDPKSAAERTALAEDAVKNQDYPGAVVEYGAALKLTEDPALREKQADAYRHLTERDLRLLP